MISLIPTFVGALLSGVIAVSQSKSLLLQEMNTKCSVMDEKINNNKELVLSLMAESEKRRTEQYQYLVKETDEIKEQLKQKKNISMLLGDSIHISPEMEYIVTRSAKWSRWADSLHKYSDVNDSLYQQLCLNLKTINSRLN